MCRGLDWKQYPHVQRRKFAQLQFWLVYCDFTWFASSTTELDNGLHVNPPQTLCQFLFG